MKRVIGAILMVCCLGLTVAAQENVRGARKVIVSPEVNGTSVTLRLVAPNARRVVVQGGWLPMMSPGADMTLGNDTVWTYTANNLASDQYRYNFIVDGTRIIDPNNVFMIRDVGSLFSLFNVSGGVGDYYMVKDVPHGNVTRTWYHSATFGVDRRLTVYTPAGYDSKKSYPVFYLLHGSGGDEEAWITQGCVARIMDNLIAEGKAVPMIVVMPNGNPDKQAAPGETSENFNYTPVMSNAFPKYKDGSYEMAFPEIVKFIEKTYSVKADKSHRALAGLSMGGFHTMFISMNFPDMFDYVGLFSPGVSNNGVHLETPAYQNREAKWKVQVQKGVKLYWIGVGSEDFLYKDIAACRQSMEQCGIKDVYRETDRGHEWTNWRKYLVEFSQKLFK